jgi:hypothetical protein
LHIRQYFHNSEQPRSKKSGENAEFPVLPANGMCPTRFDEECEYETNDKLAWHNFVIQRCRPNVEIALDEIMI